jgi:putative addiction module killer protein
MIDVREYNDRDGRSPYAAWFDQLNPQAAVKVAVAVTRLGLGNFSNVKGVGSGVLECRIAFGPGTECISERTANTWLFCWAVAPRSANNATSKLLLRAGRITNVEGRRKVMALTRDFKDTIRARVARDPKFRKELLREGIECMLAGDIATAKAILRDYINATVGFTELAEATHIPSKSLMRMLGPAGNPRADNLLDVVSFLQQREGVRFHLKVSSIPDNRDRAASS